MNHNVGYNHLSGDLALFKSILCWEKFIDSTVTEGFRKAILCRLSLLYWHDRRYSRLQKKILKRQIAIIPKEKYLIFHLDNFQVEQSLRR